MLNPFKEQFYLPSVLVKQCNVFGSQLKIVGYEDKFLLSILVVEFYSPKRNRILLKTDKSWKG